MTSYGKSGYIVILLILGLATCSVVDLGETSLFREMRLYKSKSALSMSVVKTRTFTIC